MTDQLQAAAWWIGMHGAGLGLAGFVAGLTIVYWVESRSTR